MKALLAVIGFWVLVIGFGCALNFVPYFAEGVIICITVVGFGLISWMVWMTVNA